MKELLLLLPANPSQPLGSWDPKSGCRIWADILNYYTTIANKLPFLDT